MVNGDEKRAFRPKFLPEKLRKIRQILGADTYAEMIRLLNVPEEHLQLNAILYYETGRRLPPLNVLLRYSELSGISINDLVDDRVELSDFVRA